MATKHIYEVKTPNGTFTRTTSHTYRFMVCSLGEDADVIATRHAMYLRLAAKPGYGWAAPAALEVMLAENEVVIASGAGKDHGWSGSYQNAVKLLNSLKAERVSTRQRGGGFNLPRGYRNLMIVEVPQI